MTRASVFVVAVIVAALLAIGAVGLAPSASAHGGGLNSCGCHFNRRTGECHCHQDRACGCECQPPRCDRPRPR